MGGCMFQLEIKNTLKEIDFLKYNNKIADFKKWCEKERKSSTGMLGWLNYASLLSEYDINNIKSVAKYLKNRFDTLVVVGVGGSYLGTRAIIEAIKGECCGECNVIYLGNSMSARYLSQVLEYLKNRKFAVVVVSKSGKTLEPALAFRFLKDLLIKKMGNKFSEAIVAITDENSGALRSEVNELGYKSFTIPHNVGGRYSVFTSVGLLPFAVCDIDIDKFLAGVRCAEKELNVFNENNPCFRYAIARYEFSKVGKNVELFASYEPQLRFFLEWIKQLFGESEGKEKKGVLPISALYTTDLHSFGQFVQDGTPCLFETILKIQSCETDVIIPKDENNFDGLNKLSGLGINHVNDIMIDSVVKAHTQGGVSNIILSIEKLDEFNLGYLIYFFMMSCTFSCFLQGVNPFNQPGVEVYKKNALKLLKLD